MSVPAPSIPTPHIPATLRWWMAVCVGSWMFSAPVGDTLALLVSTIVTRRMSVELPQGPGDFHLGWGMQILLTSMLISSVSSGILTGMISGALQTAFLRVYGVTKRGWIGMSTITWMIVTMIDTYRMHFALGIRNYPLMISLMLLSSAIVGGAFWLALHNYVPAPRRWAIAGVGSYLIVTCLSLGSSLVVTLLW